MAWEHAVWAERSLTPLTPLDEADFVAFDVETTGHRPFLVLEIGAERFQLAGPVALFDTLVDCRAPINPYARRRHQIDRSMLVGAPEFGAARQAFLDFATGAALVEHSHDAFDSWLLGRGLRRPLEHPIIDTTALARLLLDLPAGQTPGLARLVAELEIESQPDHAALQDAQATAAVFRRLIERARQTLGWETVGDILASIKRPVIDRSAMEAGGLSRTGSAERRLPGGRARRGRRRGAGSHAPPDESDPAPPAPPAE